jgi:hypothetical protein
MNHVIQNYEIKNRVVDGSGREMLSRIIGAVRYRQDNDVAIPIKIDLKSIINEKGIQESVYEISSYDLVSTAPGTFTLAAFGLGDFEKPSARTTNRLPLYASAAAVAALLISLLLARLAKSLRQDKAGAEKVGDSG